MRTVTILGATGSIGRSAFKVIRENPTRFSVDAVACGSDAIGLARLAIAFKAKQAVVASQKAYPDLKAALSGTGIVAAAGESAVCEAARRPVSMVVAAIMGIAGLKPVCAALEAGNHVALANKETLVSAGAFVSEIARKHNSRILPLDSEHNALLQAMTSHSPDCVKKLTLTASGGPFLHKSVAEVENASVQAALSHPNWSMGAKISIDSATMMNKGLELIEAHHLFHVGNDSLNVLIHPEQIIHGLVEFLDGSVLAGLSVNDMAIPLAQCLAFPDRVESGAARLDLTKISGMTFYPENHDAFPALGLARAALIEGGGAPTALNAANEAAVAAYLGGRIRFGEIVRLVARALERFSGRTTRASPTLSEALDIDRDVRLWIQECYAVGIEARRNVI